MGEKENIVFLKYEPPIPNRHSGDGDWLTYKIIKPNSVITIKIWMGGVDSGYETHKLINRYISNNTMDEEISNLISGYKFSYCTKEEILLIISKLLESIKI